MGRERRSTPLAGTCAAPHTCPRPLRLEVLAHAPYFADLSHDEIVALDERAKVRGYAEGEAIYHAGSAAEHLFLLAPGRIKVLRPSLDDSDVLVEVITPGATFG